MPTNLTRRSGPEPPALNIQCAFCGGFFHSYCTTPRYWDTLWHPAGRTSRQAIDPTSPVVNFCHTCGRPNQATLSLIRRASHRRTSRFTLHCSFMCDSYPTTVNHITVEVVGQMRDFAHAHCPTHDHYRYRTVVRTGYRLCVHPEEGRPRSHMMQTRGTISVPEN